MLVLALLALVGPAPVLLALGLPPAAAAPGPPLVVPAGAYAWPLAGVDGSAAPERAGAVGTATRL
ncbi:MAG TPA: hypothetical protein VK935_21110, partial [Actinomycetospora sp.]|nr:hypothetical protein [Actinomycetospora sp.]